MISADYALGRIRGEKKIQKISCGVKVNTLPAALILAQYFLMYPYLWLATLLCIFDSKR